MAAKKQNPKQPEPTKLSDLVKKEVVIQDHKLVRVEPEIKTKNVALAAFVGGVVAYIVWVLFHLTSKMIGALDSFGWVAALAATSEAGEAILAGVAVAAGGTAAAEVYTRLQETVYGIHSDPPPPDKDE